MNRLSNKVALVIGGAKGIGLGIARRFAVEGAEVFMTGRSEADLAAAALEIGATARVIRADASDPAEVRRAVDQAARERGRLDVLVVNAGLSEHSRLDEATEEHFDRTMALNLRAPVFAVKAALPHMGRGGAVVLIGSIAGELGSNGYGIYGASKAGLRALARTWTRELAARGIRVNVVSPGPVDTAMFAAASEELRSSIADMVPLGRMGRVEEVAAAALFLASDESSFVAGAELCVDGGMAQV